MGLFNILIEWLYAITLAIGAAVMARTLLWYMDKAIGINFKKWLDGADHNAKAIYFSARFIGVCLLFGLALS